MVLLLAHMPLVIRNVLPIIPGLGKDKGFSSILRVSIQVTEFIKEEIVLNVSDLMKYVLKRGKNDMRQLCVYVCMYIICIIHTYMYIYA